MRPDPVLLERLSGSRFLTDLAKPSVGIGERRSSSHGVGLEFSAHRPYREGDDLRRLDPRVRARLGQNYIRQYAEDRQLPITIVLDASASMLHGGGKKFQFALALTQILAFIGLAAGDLVKIAVVTGDELIWSPKWQSLSRSEEMFTWVASQVPSGRASFATKLGTLAGSVPAASLLIMVSDWWTDDIGKASLAMAEYNHQILAIHLEAPEELDPTILGDGLLRLIDSETGDFLELVLDETTVKSYHSAYAERTEALRSKFTRWGGHYLRVNTTATIPDVFLSTLQSLQIIT